MKMILITGVLLLFSFLANAQQTDTKNTQQTGTKYDDKASSPPTPPPPPEVNRANKMEAIKSKSSGEIDAEKQAKDKGSNKNQTQVNPEKVAPIVNDTVKRPRPVRQ